MMTLTPIAVQAVNALVTRLDVDADTGGLRIAPGESPEADAPLELAVVDGPEATDQTIDVEGTRVFLEATAAEQLDGKRLDAHVEHGRVQFVLMKADAATPQVDREPPV